MRLILASASPRRAALLGAAGYRFEVLAVEVDERARGGESAPAYVRRLAMEKSAAAHGRLGSDAAGLPLILGADTAVVVDGGILGKPRDDAESAWMLRRLSGRPHEVLTGLSLRRGRTELGGVITTVVHVARLSETDIGWYVATGEGRDKAGGYGIQGLASRFIPRIDGSYTNVVGLPIAEAAELIGRLSGAEREEV
ncbi:MAG: septum formation inhibitor Maf [Acidobacteria bacterium]|nr:septum formation inhibitor Maf [Acidobacteriota bacterium]